MTRLFLLYTTCCLLIFSCTAPENESKNNQKQVEESKVFRYNQSEGLTSLDPANASTQANIRATSQIYNSLFEFTSDLFEQPQLAESYDISDDGLVYTFNIKKGVYFHDNKCFEGGKGREMTATDFVYSFSRIADPSTASRGAWIFNDKVHKDQYGNVDDQAFVALDKYTLQITLAEAYPPFLEILAMPYTFVVPKEAVDMYGKDFGRNPVGTGPFFLKEWDEDNRMVMLKNENYWRKDILGKPLPYLDAVQIDFIADKGQELLNFKQGNLDFISNLDAETIDQIINKDGSFKKEMSDQFVVQKFPYLNTEYIGFQLDPATYIDKNHPILDLKVRQAMAYAVNREEIVSYLRNGLGIPATHGFVPTAMPSFEEGRVQGYGFDPDKAKKLLAEAGYKDGNNFPAVTLYTTPNHRAIGEQLQKTWEDVLSIKITVEINDFAAHNEMVGNGNVSLFRGNWIADYPDEENFLSVFYGDNFAPAGPNKTRYKNTTFDNSFFGVHTEKDPFKRHDTYRKLDQLVMNDCPVIVLYYDEVLRMHQKRVKGIEPNPMNSLFLEKVDIVFEESNEDTAAR